MEKVNQENIKVTLNENENCKSEDLKIRMKDDTQKSCDENILKRAGKRISIKFNKSIRNLTLVFCGHCAVLIFAIFAGIHWHNEGQKPLSLINGFGLFIFILTSFYWSLFYYRFVKPILFSWLRNLPLNKFHYSCSFISSCSTKLFYTVPPVLFTVFLIYDTANDRRRLISLSGILVIYTLGFLFSKYPSHIRWDILYRGTLIQILMGLCTVRWETGRVFFEQVGNKIEKFLSYSYVGAAFVYSDNLIYKQSVFAFLCLSVLYFINFLVEVLFYYEILQRIISKFGWFLQTTIGCTTIETVNSCVSVLFGMNEAALVIKNYIKDLTLSELQAVMLGQLSTVAGSVFAAYVSFGVQPGYLVTSSLMSAPAALSLSKLLYPETEKSKSGQILMSDNNYKEKFSSALSAGCHGALSAVDIVNGIIASLIAFISIVAFGNGVVSWLGELVGYEGVTIITILGKCFIPVAFLMGIDPSQCELVGTLIATKAVLNEFVAYQKLGEYKKLNILSKKSEAIATYALCSFSNPGSVASMIAIYSSLCPEQTDNCTKLIFRAYIGGIVTCFITACIAGLLTPIDYSQGMLTIMNNTNISMN